MRYVLYGLLAIFFIANLWVLLTGRTFIYTVLYHNLADIDDYKIFTNRTIQKSSQPQPWKTHLGKPLTISTALKEELEGLQSIALLYIRHDTILYEQYWDGYSDSSLSNSFSMAKSYVGAMVGVCLEKKLIKDIDQKLADFFPDFKSGRKNEITIRHLLTMSSGLNWKEEYLNPFSTVSEAYYGDDLHKIINRLKVVDTPGKVFKYKGGDTQLLAFLIEKVSGLTLSEFAEKYLWEPLGAENKALWSLDKKNGSEKASCCLNSNARDFARMGKLYLQNGSWNGHSIISSDFIRQSITPNGLTDADGKVVDYYGFQWWIIPEYKGHSIFYARGVSGQYIIVVPDADLIIVRLGKKRGEKVGSHLKEVFSMIDQGLAFP